MNNVTWIGYDFMQLTKEFETVEELTSFMKQEDIKPYITKVTINGIPLVRDCERSEEKVFKKVKNKC